MAPTHETVGKAWGGPHLEIAVGQPDETDQDEVDGDDIVQEPRYYEDQGSGDQGHDGMCIYVDVNINFLLRFWTELSNISDKCRLFFSSVLYCLPYSNDFK